MNVESERKELIKYYKKIHPDKDIDNNISFDEIFYLLNNKRYEDHLNEKKINNINLEKKKFDLKLMKKKNIKILDIYLSNKISSEPLEILKNKKDKEIIILNVQMKTTASDNYSNLKDEYGVQIINNNELLTYKKPFHSMRIIYFYTYKSHIKRLDFNREYVLLSEKSIQKLSIKNE